MSRNARTPSRRHRPIVTPMSGERTGAVNPSLLSTADRELARSIAQLSDADPHAELALMLAIRGMRLGHVCVDLASVAGQSWETDDEAREAMDADDLDLPLGHEGRWPALDAWLAALNASALVSSASSLRATPLIVDGSRVYLHRMFSYERRLQRAIESRVSADRAVPVNAERRPLSTALDMLFGPVQPGAPMDRQRLAAAMASVGRLSVVAGGPGTGKTTTVKKILALLLAQAEASPSAPLRIALAAPTGKAAARLRESITEGLDGAADHDLLSDDALEYLASLPATTVHRLLGPRGDSRSRFRHDAEHPLPFDVVVVDEASMIPLSLMTKLFEATPPHARLILLGDRNQLASVEAGAVLGDICGPPEPKLRYGPAALAALRVVDPAGADALEGAEDFEVQRAAGVWDAIVTLQRVHRFREDAGIGQLAAALQRPGDAKGAVHEILGGGSDGPRFADLEFIGCPLPQTPALTHLHNIALQAFLPIVDGAHRGEDATGLLDQLGRFRILCAHRRGAGGAEQLGQLVERWIFDRRPSFDPSAPHALGRPILVLENDHEQRLYNGDVGIFVRHPSDPARTCVAFADSESATGVRYVSPGRLPRHEAVFTMSIHKSQGSQFEHAVVVLPPRPSLICTRELVYTGITRARRRLTLAAEPSVLDTTLDRRVQRGSGLREILW